MMKIKLQFNFIAVVLAIMALVFFSVPLGAIQYQPATPPDNITFTNAPPEIPGNDIYSYVLFATNELVFKGGGGTLDTGGMIVGGNIGVNNAGGSLAYSTSGKAIMSSGSWAVAGSANSGPQTGGSLYWLYANSVNQAWIGGSGATVQEPNPATQPPTGVGQYPWTSPLLTMPALPFTPSYQRMASASDLTLGTGGIAYPAGGYNLSPGDYRNVEFKNNNGSNPAVINFSDGVYNMRSLKVFSNNPGIVINVTDGTILQIDQNFDAGDRMRFGANTQHHGCAQVYVGSIKNDTNAFYNTSTTVTTNWGHHGRSSGGSLHMQYYAPNGWLDLGGDMELYGRYWAYKITGDPGNNVYLEGSCGSPVPPVPEVQTGILLGLGLAVIGALIILKKRQGGETSQAS